MTHIILKCNLPKEKQVSQQPASDFKSNSGDLFLE